MTWFSDASASSVPAIQATTMRPPTVPTPSIIQVMAVISAPPMIALQNALQSGRSSMCVGELVERRRRPLGQDALRRGDEDQQRAAEDVHDRRDRPQLRELELGELAAPQRGDRDEEVLGEELRAPDDDEDERDPEEQRADEVRRARTERRRHQRGDGGDRDDAEDDVEAGDERGRATAPAASASGAARPRRACARTSRAARAPPRAGRAFSASVSGGSGASSGCCAFSASVSGGSGSLGHGRAVLPDRALRAASRSQAA